MKTDRGVIFLVIALLGGITFALVVGTFALLLSHVAVPDTMLVLIGTGFGALGGVLSKTSTSDAPQQVEVVNAPQDPQPVQVMNTPGDAVPVEQADA